MNHNKLIMVCSACKTASCWHGEFMCDDAKHADTELKTVAELHKFNLEREDRWSDQTMQEIYGEPAPFGEAVK